MLSVYTGSDTAKLLEVIHFQGEPETHPATGHEVIVKNIIHVFWFQILVLDHNSRTSDIKHAAMGLKSTA